MPISTGPISSTPITTGPITAPDSNIITLVPLTKGWVWKTQAAIFSLNLGVVLKGWIWSARVPIITTGVFKIIPSPPKAWSWLLSVLLSVPAITRPPPVLSYEFQYGGLVSAYNTGQLTAQQFYSKLYALQWAFSGLTDWNSSLRPRAKPGDLPPIPLKTNLPGLMISNQADQVVDAATLVATALALLSHGILPRGFPAPYPPPWAFALYGGR